MIMVTEIQSLVTFSQRIPTKINKSTFANHVLILNLAFSDLLMGIYLCSLCLVDTLFRGVYCLKSQQWLYGYPCKALGVLVTLSSQASVLTMVLLTLFRAVALADVSFLSFKALSRPGFLC